MVLLIITILWFLTLSYFLLYLIRILIFRNRLRIKKIEKEFLPFVSVIIPARNEENNIERAVKSLLIQSYPPDNYEIIVVNDNSTDDTENIVKKIARNDERVKIVNKGEPEPGWTGKNSACMFGALKAKGEYLCFIDADTKSETDLLMTAVTFAIDNSIDLLTVSPFQEIGSFSEKIFLPGVFLLIASSINFKKINSPKSSEAIANGQFIMFRREVYEKTGGHSSVKSIVMEDIALSSMIKEKGFKLFFIFGDNYISTRMYKGVKEIWDGFSKNISAIMGNKNPASIILSSLKSFFLALAPVIIPIIIPLDGSEYIFYSKLLYIISISGFLIFSFISLKEMGLSPIYSLFFPLGFVLHGLISINSIFKQRKGQTKWKGRKY